MESAFRDKLLDGKVAVIAGGSSGINLGIARGLGRAGARLAILSRNAERVEAAVQSLRDEGCTAMGRSVDVRDYDGLSAFFAEVSQTWGLVDIVISGAAGNFHAPAAHLSPNGFKTVVEIDLIGNFNVLRASFDHLRKPGASLISITAPGGSHPSLFQVHANSAKAGINMTTKCLAMEWGPAGVRVNGISPGPIAGTEGMARLAATPEREAQIKSQLALRDYGQMDDIANTAVFLCSEAGRYITGTIIDCDGGMVLGDASRDALKAPPSRPR